MINIISQDRRTIVNAESIEKIEVDGGVIFATTINGGVTELGRYQEKASLEKVMDYIALSMAGAVGGKAIIMPTEDAVKKSHKTFKSFLKDLEAKKTETTVKLTPEAKEALDKLKGGEGK